MGSWNPTSEFGHRLLHVTIDAVAQDDPDRVFVSLPYDDADLSKGYEDITYPTYANAINKLAWFLEDSFGKADRFPTIAYLGKPDIRYHILQMACAKTGYKGLFSSHSNSPAGHLGLMAKTDATFLLSASGVKVDDILAARPMKHALIPELNDLLSVTQARPYPYNKTFDEAKDDPFLILHSSGTTGLPKPIMWTHGCAAALDAHRGLPEMDPGSGRKRRFTLTHPMSQRRMFLPFMHFHGIASVVAMISTVFGKAIYVPGFRNHIVSREHVFDIIEHARPDDGFVSPAMLEDLANHPACGDYVSRLGTLFYGGAPIHHEAAARLSKYTYLQNQWGITEGGKIMDLQADPEDYDWCTFDIASNGLEFRPRTDELYEMVIHKTPESEPYVAFFRRDSADVWYVGDLWRPHPDPKKAGHTWQFAGRTDDLISYKDGNNFHPLHYELKHSEHDIIRTAIISGSGHRQPLLLIELKEPTSDSEKHQEILDRLWTESVVPINAVAPANGQIARTHMLLSTPDKPFERNVKGTVARKPTIRNFEQQIEMSYVKFGDESMYVESRFDRE